MSSANEVVTHFAAQLPGTESVLGEPVCGAKCGAGERVTSQVGEATCSDCLVEPEALAFLSGLEVERLSIEDPDFFDGPDIACSSMHEHDDVACAAPSPAEMMLDVAAARPTTGYETEEQAREGAARLVGYLRIVRDTLSGPELGREARKVKAAYLAGALKAAGVELGEFDDAIVGWLAGWEPETVQAVVRWIESAAAGAAVR